MTLKIIQLDSAAALLDQPIYRELRASATLSDEASDTVSRIIEDVRGHGDDAVVKYMRQWTDPAFDASRIAVPPGELDKALDATPKAIRDALELAIENVAAYQRHIKPADPEPVTLAGAELGLRFTPMASVGLAVPGGKASYPSSVVMLAVPAIEAGVPPEALSIVSPPPTRREGEEAGDISPLVLAACRLVGVKKVYRIGGAQAIAALALGTQRVEAVDFIAGPGNLYTQLAKQQLIGRVGIDGFYGPSEIVTIADDTADPRKVASDLIAQAEHDPGRCLLISWSRDVIDKINSELSNQVSRRGRRAAIEQSFDKWSAAFVVPYETAAIAVCDLFAAEHVSLAVADPVALFKKLKHGGEFFLGDTTPVAAGDYYAGPSHCLPTATTARFASGVSVYTFLKRSGTVRYPGKTMPPEAVQAITTLAQAEGLDGHAHSAKLRGE
ncbi:MAG: histidinol dehydrogenase [Phycisphaera sp.]|nr:histidinol dehydrogenase [Phycisphaera sp.]